MWRKALTALVVIALLTVGLGIIVYVGLARKRILPTPTPVEEFTLQPSPMPVPSVSPTDTPVPRATMVGTVREYSPGALIIVLTPIEGEVEQIIVTESLVVTHGDGSRASPEDIAPGDTLFAEGPLDSLGRMIASSIILTSAVEQPTATLSVPSRTAQVVPTSLPPVSPTLAPRGSWRGEYYANRDLAGGPALVRDDARIDFDWGTGSPASPVPADDFSVCWTRIVPFDEGAYRFSVCVDDGVRMWIDDVQIIEGWQVSSVKSHLGYRWLAGGLHTLRVEYFEAGGDASAHLWWEEISAFEGWRGEYFANAELEGPPAFMRDDEVIDFDWASGSPGLGLPEDNFSVRWTRTMALAGANYRIWAIVDDGVRLYLDGHLLVDEWRDAPARRCEVEAFVDQGAHDLAVEYYERGDKAMIRVGWDAMATVTPSATSTSIAPTATVPPTATSTPTLTATSTWTPHPPTSTPTLTVAPSTQTPVKTPKPKSFLQPRVLFAMSGRPPPRPAIVGG